MDADIELLYEQGPCLAVLKPTGLATQAAPGVDSLEVRVKAWIKRRDQKPAGVYLGVPHRLDRPVSGVVVLARHVRAARRLAEQFEARAVHKTYWACVGGRVTPPEGVWTDTLRKVPNEPRAELVSADSPDGRLAVLRYRTLGITSHGSWLEIELETGRMHQIRLQAASRGHPVLGDEMYGATVAFGPQHEDHRLRAIALHGRSLRFRHPMTQEWVSVTAPLAADWNELAEQANIHVPPV